MAMIYLIRHGQASFLKSDYDQLSELGAQQSSILGEALKKRNQSFRNIVRGSLKRHHQTANHCLKHFENTTEIVTDPRWNEYDHMELLQKHNPAFTDYSSIGEHIKQEENPMKALQQLLNASILDWITSKHSYDQSWAAFKKGALDALHDIAKKLNKGETTWVFTSGGPISAILIELLSLKDQQFIDLQGRLVNSSVTKIVAGRDKNTLSTYNDYSHLDHNNSLLTFR